MNIKAFFSSLLQKPDAPKFEVKPDSQGLNFFTSKEFFQRCQQGDPKLDDSIVYQFLSLQMLAEQGAAKPIANGFFLSSEEAVKLSEEDRLLLGLPENWPGQFEVEFEGTTTHPSFNIRLKLIHSDGSALVGKQFQVNGPLLKLAHSEIYLPSPEQWHLLRAVQKHNGLLEKTEYDNLAAVYQLQQAAAEGCKVQLAHFNDLEAVAPDAIGVGVKVNPDGSLTLNPSVDGVDIERLAERLGQLDRKGKSRSIRVGKQIVLLDEQKLQGVQEILKSRTIPKEQVKDFFRTPTAFLDASLVDLDQGFSLRVQGVSVFEHGYFGDTEESGIDWFSAGMQKDFPVKPAAALVQAVETEEDLEAVEKQVADAKRTGAEIVTVNGQKFNVSDEAKVKEALEQAKEKINTPDSHAPDFEPLKKEDENKPLAVGIAKNDENEDYGEFTPERIQDVSYTSSLNFDYLKRQPFPHQLEGIRWLLGLARESMNCSPKDSLHGALLADDMGLGKTFMSLVGVSEYYRICREQGITERPVMVVAPLSLLENWHDEVEETFHNSPFDDVIILQANAELKRFRKQGFGSETKAKITEGKEFPYSLQVGSGAGTARLDMPRRLVLTSYQTLRDYQFSLCQIDWSFVIFDEAQFIKSPNTLATVAAKGLKACFKLLATGTPVENHLGDFWCLMDTAKPGVLGSYQDFRKQYMVPIAKADSSVAAEVKNDIGRTLRQRVGPLMLRRLKEDNLEGLPDKHIWVGINELEDERHKCLPGLAASMKGEQLKSYDDIVQDVMDAKTMDNAQGVVLPALMKLRAVSLHPQLIESSKPELPASDSKLRTHLQQSAKMAVLLQTLDDIRKRQEKVIIFSINKKLQLMLANALKRVYGVKVSVINGDTKAVKGRSVKENETRKGLIQEFEANPGFGVIIMSPVAAGMGLTVVGANNVIHLERHWNPAKEAQASDRVYRIGQTKDVHIYLPMALHPSMSSFDDNLHKLLCNKTTLKDAVVTPEEVKGEEMASGCFG